MKTKVVEFLRKKDYKLIKEIDQGGTGRTVLLEDELIGESFVCKKYSPYYEEDKALYFNNFVEEIRLLHLIYHRNVVRVFNYHLYPDYMTGYILMEYIKGVDIETYLKQNPNKINTVFEQTVEGFKYLEQNKILHRDFAPKTYLFQKKILLRLSTLVLGKRLILVMGLIIQSH